MTKTNTYYCVCLDKEAAQKILNKIYNGMIPNIIKTASEAINAANAHPRHRNQYTPWEGVFEKGKLILVSKIEN